MKVQSYLATADGRWIDAAGGELLELIGDPRPDFDAAAFAVRNLGFAQFEVLGDCFIQIRIFPKRLDPNALDLVRSRILQHPTSLIRVIYLDAESKRWEEYLTSNPRQAVGRLNELSGAYRPCPSALPYSAEPKDFSAVMADENHSAHALSLKWRSSLNQFDENVLTFMTRYGLDRTGMIISVDPQRPVPIFRFIGPGFSGYDQQFYFRALGEKVESQPDKEYGHWVAPFYTEVAMTWRPRFDSCTARVNDAKGSRNFRYERLILPWSTGSGEVLLTLSSRYLDVGAAPAS